MRRPLEPNQVISPITTFLAFAFVILIYMPVKIIIDLAKQAG